MKKGKVKGSKNEEKAGVEEKGEGGDDGQSEITGRTKFSILFINFAATFSLRSANIILDHYYTAVQHPNTRNAPRISVMIRNGLYWMNSKGGQQRRTVSLEQI